MHSKNNIKIKNGCVAWLGVVPVWVGCCFSSHSKVDGGTWRGKPYLKKAKDKHILQHTYILKKILWNLHFNNRGWFFTTKKEGWCILWELFAQFFKGSHCVCVGLCPPLYFSFFCDSFPSSFHGEYRLQQGYLKKICSTYASRSGWTLPHNSSRSLRLCLCLVSCSLHTQRCCSHLYRIQ